jgi:hypothetical protein
MAASIPHAVSRFRHLHESILAANTGNWLISNRVEQARKSAKKKYAERHKKVDFPCIVVQYFFLILQTENWKNGKLL